MATTQRRAKRGGEVGANGEMYRGGAFIATTEAPKGSDAQMVRGPRPHAPVPAPSRMIGWLPDGDAFVLVIDTVTPGGQILSREPTDVRDYDLRAVEREMWRRARDERLGGCCRFRRLLRTLP